MSKKYIVMERGYEYNDEGYSTSEYGQPVIVFDSEGDAKLNLTSRLCDPSYLTYLEGKEAYNRVDYIEKQFPGIIEWGDRWGDDNNSGWVETADISKLSGLEIQELYKLLGFDPLFIVEVEGE